ncbi:MAG: efflux RND transporter periplasmic adaptor subunit [Ignavibacteria bacterium]|nr:efflux RND transporter periplasmic adaptor subunit [Ignavibacteria bacterium]
MENKSKYLYLILGIIIGGLVVYGLMSFTDSNTFEKKMDHIERGHDDDEHGYNDGEEEEHNESVMLSDEELSELGIAVEKVNSQKLQLHKDLTGEIVPNPGNVAHIVPRFTGVVKTVYKKIGDRVNKDEIIAVIESNESLVTYEVNSSIDGVVLELHMTPGELIGDDKHVVTVADLSSVWAELNVYQKDLRIIRVGQPAEIYFDEIENAVKGKIFYLSPTVDEHTRTATARVRLNNSRGYWKPGMFVSSKVSTDFVNVEQAVSLNSIQNFEGQKVVFVRDGDGFKPQPVTIGKTNTKYAEVLTGLNKGQTYIAQGAFVIKSELLKESFGGDDDH